SRGRVHRPHARHRRTARPVADLPPSGAVMKAVLSSFLLAAGLILVPAGAASAAPPDCAAATPGGPVQVTPGCVDPLYADPVIDSEQDLSTPVTHHRVSGHFDGTDVKFTIYLPP